MRRCSSAILSSMNMPPMPPMPGEDESPQPEHPIPPDAIGRVMGFAGSSIKRIQADTQCSMKWVKAQGMMQLWGTQEQVRAGKARLEETIEEARSQREADPGGYRGGYDDRGHGGGGHDGGRDGGMGDSVAEVPARGQAGFLIGRGGETIKRMEYESGASLNLDSETQIMRITGHPRSVEMAKRMVEDCVERGIRKNSAREQRGAQQEEQEQQQQQQHGGTRRRERGGDGGRAAEAVTAAAAAAEAVEEAVQEEAPVKTTGTISFRGNCDEIEKRKKKQRTCQQ